MRPDEVAAARARVAAGDLEGALPLLEELARRRPDGWEVHALLASTAAALGRPEAAVPALEERLARGGDEAHRAADLLGNLLEDAGRWPEAEERYREALARAPAWAPSHRKLSRLMVRQGRYDEALAVARAGVEAAPADAPLRAWLGEVLLGRERHEEAERVLRETLELEGAGAYPRYLLGLVHLATGRNDEARVQLEAAAALDPGVWEAWYQLANALDRLGEAAARDRALARFEKLYRRRLEEGR